MNVVFKKVTIIGLGLIGSSIAHGIKQYMPGVQSMGYDQDSAVRDTARRIELCDHVADSIKSAVQNADLIILCVPVGAMGDVGRTIADHVQSGVIISDVGSCKASVAEALAVALPGICVIPAHPVAGTEQSGPEAGFASLFHKRWCILTPLAGEAPENIAKLQGFWEALGADVEIMDAQHHDMVLAVTSHLPHLIAYTIVGTASDLETVTQSEVIKFSAGGFRDFTRIAASDPTMWRDVFLSNKQAVLAMLQQFSEDLSALQRAIRWDKGDELFELFSRTRTIRRSIIEQGQDDAAADFGRSHE